MLRAFKMLIKDENRMTNENKAVRNRIGLYNGIHCIKIPDHMSFQSCFKTVFVLLKDKSFGRMFHQLNNWPRMLLKGYSTPK